RAEVIGLWHHPYPPSRSNMDWRGTDPLAPAAGPARGIRQQKFWAEKWSFKMGAMLFLQARVAIESKLGRPRLRRGNACAPPPPCPDLLRERRFPELICLRRRGPACEAPAMDLLPLAPLPDRDDPPSPPAVSDAEIGAARGYVEASRAASTRRAYEGDWRSFSAWCRDRSAAALPAAPALVAVYLSALAQTGKTPPTIGRALAAIAHTHKRAGHTPPHRAAGGQVIADVLAGVRRSRATPPQRKAPADAELLSVLLRSIAGDGLAALRDRALLAFGMALTARRSELVALDVADL